MKKVKIYTDLAEAKKDLKQKFQSNLLRVTLRDLDHLVYDKNLFIDIIEEIEKKYSIEVFHSLRVHVSEDFTISTKLVLKNDSYINGKNTNNTIAKELHKKIKAEWNLFTSEKSLFSFHDGFGIDRVWLAIDGKLDFINDIIELGYLTALEQ